MAVLVVDDNRITRDVLRVLLESEGIPVHCSESGKAAIHLAREERFGTFLIDYRIPDMMGDEVAAIIRKERPDATIIGFSIEFNEQAFLRAGADAFILKDQLHSRLIPLIKGRNDVEFAGT